MTEDEITKPKFVGENIEKEEPEKLKDIATVTKTITDFITKKPKTKVIVIRNVIIKNLIEDMPKNLMYGNISNYLEKK